MFDVEVHPQYASNGWIYLSYSEVLPGYTPPATPPADASAPAAAAPPVRRVADGPWRSARSADDDGDHAREDQQGRPMDGPAGPLPRAGGRVQLEQRALRIALHLRQGGASLLHARREAADDGRAGSLEGDGQDPSRERRRVDPEGQSVRRPLGGRAVDLELRPPQPAGARVGSRHRQAVGVGARPAGWRRDQHHRAGEELRLGRDHDGRAARHHQAVAGGDGAANRVLDAVSGAERHRLLHRRQISRAGRTTCSSAASAASS